MSDLKIGGRLYSPVNMERRTVQLDVHLRRLMSESRLDRATPHVNEPPEEYGLRLYSILIASGRVCELLGCYLLPVGRTERDWSPDLAADTARQIGQCDTEEDRQLVQQLAAEAVLGFFQRELRSLATSLTYSRSGREGQGDRSAAH